MRRFFLTLATVVIFILNLFQFSDKIKECLKFIDDRLQLLKVILFAIE